MDLEALGRGSSGENLEVKEFHELKNKTENRKREIKEKAELICEQRHRLFTAVDRRAEQEKNNASTFRVTFRLHQLALLFALTSESTEVFERCGASVKIANRVCLSPIITKFSSLSRDVRPTQPNNTPAHVFSIRD
jgi:hypothetical protein